MGIGEKRACPVAHTSAGLLPRRAAQVIKATRNALEKVLHVFRKSLASFLKKSRHSFAKSLYFLTYPIIVHHFPPPSRTRHTSTLKIFYSYRKKISSPLKIYFLSSLKLPPILRSRQPPMQTSFGGKIKKNIHFRSLFYKKHLYSYHITTFFTNLLKDPITILS
jgi:hypothetical protein